MAAIYNEQRILGIRLVADGTILYNHQPVIGIRAAVGGVMFTGNDRVLGVDVLPSDKAIHNEQPVIGAVLIGDARTMYNGKGVIPARAISGELAPPDPGSWTPLDLGASLLAWWDASEGKTLVGSQVSAWADRKNGITVSQATASARPVYSDTGFGGAPGVYFDGVDDAMLVASHPFPIGNDGSEMWSSVQQDKLAAVTGTTSLAVYGNRQQVRTVQGGVNRARLDQSLPVTDAIIDFSSRHLIRGQFGSPNKAITVDEAAPVSLGWSTASGATAFAIGSTTSGSGSFWQGPIRDILVTLPLTSGQAASLAAFLLPRRQI